MDIDHAAATPRRPTATLASSLFTARTHKQAVLRRAVALVPALAGLPVLSRGVGLRAARGSDRLEHVVGRAVPLVDCYRHGGAGVRLSWGCAEAVVALLQTPSPAPRSR